MHRALPLLALVLLAAGCGRAYTAADVQQALGTSNRANLQYYVDPVQRYRNSDEAWVAMHAPGRHLRVFVILQGGQVIVRRSANLILIGESQRVEATLAQLH